MFGAGRGTRRQKTRHPPRPFGERVAEGRVRGNRPVPRPPHPPCGRPLPEGERGSIRGGSRNAPAGDTHPPRPFGERVAEGRVRGNRPVPRPPHPPCGRPLPEGERGSIRRGSRNAPAGDTHPPRPFGERVAEGRVRGNRPVPRPPHPPCGRPLPEGERGSIRRGSRNAPAGDTHPPRPFGERVAEGRVRGNRPVPRPLTRPAGGPTLSPRGEGEKKAGHLKLLNVTALRDPGLQPDRSVSWARY